MSRKLSFYIFSLLFLCFLGLNFYTRVNYHELKDTVIIKEESEEAEIKRIQAIKDKVSQWEEENFPRVMPDGFNPDVTDEMRKNMKPVKGGEINVHYNSEPKFLMPWVENSAVTSYILEYVFDGLLSKNAETYEWETRLAVEWTEEDVVWLKGKNPKNLFKEKEGDNNYLIGKIQYDKIVWENKKKGLVKELPILVHGQKRVIKANELRYKTEEREKYTRCFDRGVVFKFKLRKGVKWHDGKPFTSKDVLFTLDTIKNPYIVKLANIRNYYSALKSWSAPDDYTVHCYFDKQYFKNLDFIAGLSPIPRHIFIKKNESFSPREFAEEFIKHKAIRKPVGTGPYFFPSDLISEKYNSDSFWKDKRISLLRNDNYYLPEKSGHLDRLNFHFIEKNEVALVEFRSGNLDIGSLSSFHFYKTTNAEEYRSRYIKSINYTPVYSFFGFNMKKIYFKDKRVRKAFTMLLDRPRINKNLYYGLAKNVTGNQYYFSKYYNKKIKPYPFDRKKALKLINDAGWIDTDGDGLRDKHGVPFEFTLIFPQGSSGAKEIAYFLVEELEDIGIKMKLTQLEWSVYLEHLRDHKFDMSILAWVSSPNEGDGYQIWHSSQWANKGSNFVGFNNKEADALLEKVRRTLNPEERLKMHYRFHEILHEEQPYLFLFTKPAQGMYAKRFRNVKFYKSPPGFDLTEWYVPLELQKKRQ